MSWDGQARKNKKEAQARMHIDVQLLTTSLILCGSPVRAHARARTRTQTHIHTQPSWVHV